MTDRRWSRLEELFLIAIELDTAARKEYLARECAEDPSLLGSIEALLSADGNEHSPLDQSPVDDALSLLAAAPAETMVGRRIGRYQVLREIGQGGMGEVFLASRADDHYRQRVAVKLVRRSLQTEQIYERFRRERQILANLNHPNIARLLDGGTARDGRPYLVMEYIEGESIDRYCDRRRLGVRQRLELFEQVCTAAQYAHQRLAIHRDLKPKNILVTKEGVPKLLDFGIAKILDPHPSSQEGESTSTATELRAMTPRYASPEQLAGGSITTATDVYGLGAVLYELLTGHPAHRPTGPGTAELLRAVCETEPMKPSLAVIQSPPALESTGAAERESSGEGSPAHPAILARARGAEASRLQRTLAGDLDNILLKSLRKEPERRYATAAEFADDLQRYLRGLPIRARPATPSYRVGKFLSRNKMASLVVGLLSLIILGSQVIIMKQLQTVSQQRDRAELQRTNAERISGFMVELLEVVGPGTESNRSLSARELLDRGLEKIGSEFAHHPEMRATLLLAMGTAYRKNGLFEPAQAALEEAMSLREELFGSTHSDTAAALHELGVLHSDLGHYELARSLLERARSLRAERIGVNPTDLALTLDALAVVDHHVVDLASAEEEAREALGIWETELGPTHPTVAYGLGKLGNIQRAAGDYRGALHSLQRSLEIREQRHSLESPDHAADLHAYAVVLLRLGRTDEAQAVFERALEIYTRTLGPDHPDTALANQSLAGIYSQRGDFERADRIYRRAIDTQVAATGVSHHYQGVFVHNLARSLYRQEKLDEAEPLFLQASSIFEAVAGPDSAFWSFSIHYLGAIARLRGQLDCAEVYLSHSLAVHRKFLPPGHPILAQSLHETALLKRDQGKLPEAKNLLRQALEIRRRVFGPNHPEVAATLKDLAEVARNLEKTAEAIQPARREFSILSQAQGRVPLETIASVLQ